MRRVALLSTTLTLASAARGLRALPRPLALAHVNRLASSGARAPSAVVLAAQRGGGDDSARTSPSPPPAPPRRELDIRGYAIPLVNDVVRYPSKWAGEYLLGAVDYVQALPEDRGYVIDVRPLRAVGGERWEAKRGSKLVQENSARLRVVKEATYNVQADAWTVPENVTTALFTAVKPRPADPTRVTSGLLEYDALKWRLVRESALTSAVGAVAAFAFGGVDEAQAYVLGSVAGVAYVAALARTVDTLGKGGLGEALAPLRFAAPVSPFVFLAAARYAELHGGAVGASAGVASAPFRLFDAAGGGFLASGLISPREFLAMALGVLTHRLPLLGRELQAVVATGAAEAGRSAEASNGGGAELPTSGSLVAGARLFTNAARAGDEAKRATAARAAAAAAAAGRRRPMVICGPSAVGKSTLIRRLLADLGSGLAFCVSTTTRAPRAGEVDGVDYRFVSAQTFEDAIAANGFVEWVQGGNGTYYGTSVNELRRVGETLGKAALLDVDVRGAEAVCAVPGLEPCCVFISPPSLVELERRLRARGTESEPEVEYRMRKASAEIEAAATVRLFDHYLINDDLDATYAELKAIVLRANPWLAPYDAAGSGS